MTWAASTGAGATGGGGNGGDDGGGDEIPSSFLSTLHDSISNSEIEIGGAPMLGFDPDACGDGHGHGHGSGSDQYTFDALTSAAAESVRSTIGSTIGSTSSLFSMFSPGPQAKVR